MAVHLLDSFIKIALKQTRFQIPFSIGIKDKENGKTISRASIIYTLYYLLTCMHWLKYVRFNRTRPVEKYERYDARRH